MAVVIRIFLSIDYRALSLFFVKQAREIEKVRGEGKFWREQVLFYIISNTQNTLNSSVPRYQATYYSRACNMVIITSFFDFCTNCSCANPI